MKKLIKSSILLAVFSFACVGNGQAGFLAKMFPRAWYRFNKDNFFKLVGEKSLDSKIDFFKYLYYIKSAETMNAKKRIITNEMKWNKTKEEIENILNEIEEHKYLLISKKETKEKISERKVKIEDLKKNPDYGKILKQIKEAQIGIPYRGEYYEEKDPDHLSYVTYAGHTSLGIPKFRKIKKLKKALLNTNSYKEIEENKKQIKSLQEELKTINKNIKQKIKPLKIQYFKQIIRLITML